MPPDITHAGSLGWLVGFLRMGTTGLTAQAAGAGKHRVVAALLVRAATLGAGFGAFIDEQFSQLAPNIIFVTSAQAENSGPLGGGPPPAPKITLNEAVVNRLRSLPFVDEVVPSYQAQITLESRGKSIDTTVFSIDPQKLYLIAPTIEFVEGSTIRQNDPSAIILSDRIANPPGE